MDERGNRRRVPVIGGEDEFVCHCLAQAVLMCVATMPLLCSKLTEAGGRSVNLQNDVLLPGPITGTRPGPILRPLDQPAANGIVVNVLDDLMSGLWLIYISVLPGPGLPQAPIRPVPVADGQLFEKLRAVFHQPRNLRSFVELSALE